MSNWKDIPGYEGLYQVSDCGQVKSLERVVKHYTGSDKLLKEKILKSGLHVGGYLKIELCKYGKRKTFFVHRLVSLAFLDGDNSLTVNHIDECKTNNHISNLEYLTQGDNARAWIKNNPERKTERDKKVQEALSQQVLDTQTGKVFPSIKAVGRYMHEKEGAKKPWTWFDKIRRGQQNRFKILNKENK